MCNNFLIDLVNTTAREVVRRSVGETVYDVSYPEFLNNTVNSLKLLKLM